MEGRFALLFACVLLAGAVRADSRAGAAQPADEGTVYVYLGAVPLEAERVTLSVATVSAVDLRGGEVPLKLSFSEVKAPGSRRQRLFASGRLPSGNYARLLIKVQKASLKRDAGEAALLVPDAPVSVDVPFTVARGGAVVLWLTSSGPGPLAGDVSFTPVFAARIATRPIPGRAGFASNARADSITMFDKRLREAAVVIPTAAGPSGMALDQRLARLYVACARGDEIEAVDVTAAEIVERVLLAPGDGPRELALTPDGRTLLSANATSNTVGVFDAVPLTRLERIAVGSGPSSISIDPTGRRAFVFNTLASSISVIDIGSRAVVGTLSTDPAPIRGAFSARGGRLYVLHERSPYLTVVDPAQLTVVTRARLRVGLDTIKVDTRRGLVYVGGRADPLIEFYDPNTLLPVGALRTKAGVSHLTIDVEQNALYMVSPSARTVVVGGLAEREVISEIDVGEGPYWVSVMGER